MTKENDWYYILHHPVLKPCRVTHKMRIVFDASAKSVNYSLNSLNDLLECGPNLMPNIASVFLNFRCKPIGFVADIKKAFLQTGMHDKDRRFLHFLWFKDRPDSYTVPNFQFYQFCLVPFGIAPGPFFLNGCIIAHLNYFKQLGNQYSELIGNIENNFYVDDLISGADNIVKAHKIAYEMTEIFAYASFQLIEKVEI